MDQKLIDLLDASPFEASTAEKLEAYVTSQLAKKAYDYIANKALMKNYQVNSSIMKADFVCKILILSMMRLPQTDFLSLTYMIPTQLVADPTVILIQKCSDLLERGMYREFWEKFVPARESFAEALGFVDAVRLFIVSNLRDTFRNMPQTLFQEQLGLDEASVAPFCDSNKFIEKIDAGNIVFAANNENQNKFNVEDGLRMDEGLKMVEFLRTGIKR